MRNSLKIETNKQTTLSKFHSNTPMDGLAEYRERQKMLFYKKKEDEARQIRLEHIKNKYKDILEFDPIKRSNYRIVNFLKKHFFIKPINTSQIDIDDIPSFFRYRCYVYDIESEIRAIEDLYESRLNIIDEDDEELFKESLKESLLNEKNKFITDLLNSSTVIKLPILIDLQIYGTDPKTPIYFNDKMYYLNESTRKKISIAFEKINPSSLRGEKFKQMIEHSKALCETYKKDIETII